MGWRGALLLIAACECIGTAAASTTALPFASGFSAPVEIVNAGDGSRRVFVVEQGGRIRIVRDGRVLATPFLDLSAVVEFGGERGLLGLAFHPRYRDNGRLFVNYTRGGDGATVIAAYRAAGPGSDTADPASGTVLLVVPQPFANHNGGTLRFGPDGLLYIGMGDGGSGNDPGDNAQNPQSLLGKMLRIDVDAGTPYAIPSRNPYAGGGGRAEIFALGLRNPWKFSFDRGTGDLYIADVGQSAREELDVLPAGQGAGANFGWRVMEGFLCTGLAGSGPPCGSSALAPPVLDYGHDLGCAITGGYVYRGSEAPSLVGRYVYADYCSGRYWAASRSGDGSWRSDLLLERRNGPTSFGEDEAGNLLAADATTGEVLRIVDDAPSANRVVEYYHPGLDHFFMTSFASEIDALDRGLSGWVRTGAGFLAFAAGAPGALPVCRFYLPPGFGDSHFYSASAAECEALPSRFPGFVLETTDAMRLMLPATDGRCPAGSVPLYRVWNARVGSNHRYTTDRNVRDAMVARGFIAEGDGPDVVAMCAAAPS